jgi:hypothetical protein
VEARRCFADARHGAAPGSAGLVHSIRRVVLPVLFFMACGFPRPRDVGDDAPGDSGTPIDPAASIRVSPSGDDANDGLMQPVKTVKHAIGLAAADRKITHIVLASGTYSMATGETFPYSVPSNVTIIGPAGGGATLDGMGVGPGFTVADGGLQDLDLQGFTIAITATGESSLKNIRVLSSTTAVQAESAARLTVDHLDITGSAGACATGIVLNGNSALTASNVGTRALGASLLGKDQSAASFSSANLTGSVPCGQLVRFASSGVLDVRDSLLDGGASGIGIAPSTVGTTAHASLSNVIVRNMDTDALTIANAVVDVTGGEFSHVRQTAVSIVDGTATLTGVAIAASQVGFYSQDCRLTMRDCRISENHLGGDLGVRTICDLGTTAKPGGNVFKNIGVGLSLDDGAPLVQAVGNTWKPVQGADANGKYVQDSTLSGPIACDSADINICIPGAGESIQL